MMLLGGICRESPTITVARPRPIAPTASATRICDASSKITRSKVAAPGARKFAAEAGLTRTHGVSARISSG